MAQGQGHRAPADDEPNDALLKFLAKETQGCALRLAIIRGHKSRNKAVLVSGADIDRNSCSANGSLRSPVRCLATRSATRLPSDQPHHRGCHREATCVRNIAARSASSCFVSGVGIVSATQSATGAEPSVGATRRSRGDARAPLALVYRGPAGCDDGCSEAAAAMLRSSRYRFKVR